MEIHKKGPKPIGADWLGCTDKVKYDVDDGNTGYVNDEGFQTGEGSRAANNRGAHTLLLGAFVVVFVALNKFHML